MTTGKKIPFSLLLPVYIKDTSEDFREALASVLINQSIIPDEVIIIGDGPLQTKVEEHIHSLMESFPGKVHYHPLEKNIGLGPALRYGLTLCSHEHVARMDADDIAHPERFKVQCSFFREHPEADLCGGQIQEFTRSPGDQEMKRKYYRKVPLGDDRIKEYLPWRNPFNHMTVMFKKKSVTHAGSYRDCPFFEDYDLWFRMNVAGCTMVNVPEVLVYARAGLPMLLRRHGTGYAQKEYRFFREQYRQKRLSTRQFIRVLCFRISLRLLPRFLLRLAYALSRR